MSDTQNKDKEEEADNDAKKDNGLKKLIALLFNCGCWIFVVIITTPWNFIWFFIYICECDNKIKDAKASRCAKFRRLLRNQFEFWFGFGIIFNTLIARPLLFIIMPNGEKFMNLIPIEFQVGVIAFMLIFGALLIWEGVLEEYYGDDKALKFQKSLIGDILLSGTNGEIGGGVDKRCILFHYVFLAGIVAVSFGYISNQIQTVVTTDEKVNFDNIYSWFSIVFTNMIVGYHVFVPITRFMFEYYPHTLEPDYGGDDVQKKKKDEREHGTFDVETGINDTAYTPRGQDDDSDESDHEEEEKEIEEIEDTKITPELRGYNKTKII